MLTATVVTVEVVMMVSMMVVMMVVIEGHVAVVTMSGGYNVAAPVVTCVFWYTCCS